MINVQFRLGGFASDESGELWLRRPADQLGDRLSGLRRSRLEEPHRAHRLAVVAHPLPQQTDPKVPPNTPTTAFLLTMLVPAVVSAQQKPTTGYAPVIRMTHHSIGIA